MLPFCELGVKKPSWNVREGLRIVELARRRGTESMDESSNGREHNVRRKKIIIDVIL